MPPIPPLPNMSFSGGKGGDASQRGDTRTHNAFDNSGFTVNYAPSIGQSVGGGIPWLWIAAFTGAFLLWKKKQG